MLQNPRLGAPAFAFISLRADYQWPDGWSLVVSSRREGAQAYEQETYLALDPLELVDVASAVLSVMQGL